MQKSLVLVLNCGSSSIKFAVIDAPSGDDKLSGIVQCIGMPEAEMRWQYEASKQKYELPNIDYHSAIDAIITLLHEKNDFAERLIAIGHRVVHGGEAFTKSVVINKQVLDTIKKCSHLAPLHNPANIIGIEEAQKAFPHLSNVAVFDTAFHQTMLPHAFMYAVPYEWYEKYDVRRYGFHGTSHRFVTQKAAKMLDKPYEECALISAHLGNGCSIAAVLNGKSVDTSMGLTPLEGLVMGTRSGDIDPGLIDYIASELGCDAHQVTTQLNKKSGLLGISGISSDMRTIEQCCDEGNKRALLAMEIFCYRLAKYIMSYTVPLGRLDALIFTGGIGENGPIVREKVLSWLKILNFEIDSKHNAAIIRGKTGIITKKHSSIAMVVATNEELLIAQDAAELG